LRPSGTHSTRCPAPARHFPTAAPISPGCSSPIVVSVMPLFSPGAGPGAEADVHDDAGHRRYVQRGELVAVDYSHPAVGDDPDEHAPRRAGPQHLRENVPRGLDLPVPRIRTSFPVLVEYSAKPYRPFQALPESFVLTWKYTELVTMADPSGVTTGSFSASVTWKVLPDGLNWRFVAMTRRLAASRSPSADVRLSSRSSTGGHSPTLFTCHSNASSRPSAVQDRPRESAAPDLKMPLAV